jgi:hypothetical protein
MDCSKCGFKLKDDDNFCPNCGSKNIKNRKNSLEYTERIPTLNLNTTSNEIKTKQTKAKQTKSKSKSKSPIIIGILIVIVVLSVGFGSYYISLSKLSSNNSKNSDKTSVKNNVTPKNNITSDKDANTSSDISASTNDTNTNKTDTNKIDSNDSYIFPKSGSEKLLDADVSTLSKQNLALARNEIYARHGYVFQTEPFKSYFNNKSWYEPNPNLKDSDKKLNDVELYNIQLISKYENN